MALLNIQQLRASGAVIRGLFFLCRHFFFTSIETV